MYYLDVRLRDYEEDDSVLRNCEVGEGTRVESENHIVKETVVDAFCLAKSLLYAKVLFEIAVYALCQSQRMLSTYAIETRCREELARAAYASLYMQRRRKDDGWACEVVWYPRLT